MKLTRSTIKIRPLANEPIAKTQTKVLVIGKKVPIGLLDQVTQLTNRSGSSKIIVPDEATRDLLTASGLTAQLANSYLSVEEVADLEDDAPRLFDALHNHCGFINKRLKHASISLWLALENRILRQDGIFDMMVYQAAAHKTLTSIADPCLVLFGAVQDPFLIAFKQIAISIDIPISWKVSTLTWQETSLRWGKSIGRLARDWWQCQRAVPFQPISKGSTVLFLVYTSRHVHTLWPIYNMLQKNGIDAYIVAASEDAEQVLSLLNAPYTSFLAHKTPTVRKRIRQAAVNLNLHWADIQTDVDAQASVDAFQTGMWPLLYSKLSALFDTKLGGGSMFAERFIDGVKYIEITQTILTQHSPDLLVTFNDMNVLGRCAVLAAKAMNIPSLHVQHGGMGLWMQWRRVCSDKIAVWGEAHKARLTAAGVAADKIVVTGNPRFDHLIDPIPMAAVHDLLISLDLDPQRPILLTTTQHDNPAATREQIVSVIAALDHFPEYQLIIKIHPAEHLEPYTKLLRQIQAPPVCLTKDADLFTLLEASSALVTRFSTTGLEAMLKGKPVITINYSGQPDKMPYAKAGAALGVYHPNDFISTLRLILEDLQTQTQLRKQQERFIREYAFRIDGQATQRIVDLISQTVGSSIRQIS